MLGELSLGADLVVFFRDLHRQRHGFFSAFGDGVEEPGWDVGAALGAEVLRPELQGVKHRRLVPQGFLELLLEPDRLGGLHLEFISRGFQLGSERRASLRGVGPSRGHLVLEPSDVRLLRLQRGVQGVALGGHALHLSPEEVVLALLGLERLLRPELLVLHRHELRAASRHLRLARLRGRGGHAPGDHGRLVPERELGDLEPKVGNQRTRHLVSE